MERKPRPGLAQALEQELLQFLAPLVARLDTLLDKRLVRTLVRSIVALAEWRNRAHGVLLSGLGAYICLSVIPRMRKLTN